MSTTLSPERINSVLVCAPVVPDGFLLTTTLLNLYYGSADADRCTPDPHVHAEHLLVWPEEGSCTVEIEQTPWRIGLGQGVWIPAGTPHAAPRESDSALCCTHIVPRAWRGPIGVAGLVSVDAALRELLLHLAVTAMPADRRLRAQRVCLEMIGNEARAVVQVPTPRDPRITSIATAIVRDPADDRSLDDWAWRTSMSARTIARAFRADTGMTFTQWRTCARMAAAVNLLASGVPVGQVAHRVGYSTISAFTAAFHRTVGRTPHHYLSAR